MISIPLPDHWWKMFNPEEFSKWIIDNELIDGEWDFSTGNTFGNPVMMFTHEEDAIAFRLRFSV